MADLPDKRPRSYIEAVVQSYRFHVEAADELLGMQFKHSPDNPLGLLWDRPINRARQEICAHLNAYAREIGLEEPYPEGLIR